MENRHLAAPCLFGKNSHLLDPVWFLQKYLYCVIPGKCLPTCSGWPLIFVCLRCLPFKPTNQPSGFAKVLIMIKLFRWQFWVTPLGAGLPCTQRSPGSFLTMMIDNMSQIPVHLYTPIDDRIDQAGACESIGHIGHHPVGHRCEPPEVGEEQEGDEDLGRYLRRPLRGNHGSP